VAAAVLFGLSVTPSMVPRGPEWQGLLGGVVAALGYGLWWAAARLADWLGLLPRRGLSRGGRRAAFGAAALIAAAFLWQGAGWQASILAAWGLPPAGASAPLRVALVAGLVFVALLGLGRLFLLLAGRWRRRGERLLPPRLAQVLGLAVAAAVFYALIDGLALRGILRSIDRAAQIADGFVPPDTAPPARATVSGGPASRLDWAGLGQWGRSFVASGPSAADIAAFWQAPAAEPVRVYAGLAAAATPEARARLALNDLVRLGGFDRGTLVIAMPTGSGWLDPGGIDTLEYILRGDVATVAVQYSYLSSPVSVIVDPAAGLAEAQALFDLVYRHWAALPRDARPRLYLHGLSLGAFLSQETVPLLDLFADPIDGALWVGSPFLSAFWQDVQARRLPDSPAWRPRFGNGSLIRTMNQDGGLARFDADWGPMRLVLLQYGSDPIVFFDWSLAWSRPAWLGGDRAPDLAPDMRWIPLVTLFQVGVDMAVAVGRLGYGHDYAARHYIPAWAAVLDPESWTPETEARLVAHLSGLMPR
jgi:uncharacterized membrane protein